LKRKRKKQKRGGEGRKTLSPTEIQSNLEYVKRGGKRKSPLMKKKKPRAKGKKGRRERAAGGDVLFSKEKKKKRAALGGEGKRFVSYKNWS